MTKKARRAAPPLNFFRLALLFLALAAPACGAPDGQEKIREVNRWNAYVDLNNNMAAVFFQPLENYFVAFGRAPEYRPAAERHDLITFVASFPSQEQLLKTIEETRQAAEGAESELDEAAKALLPPLAELVGLLAESRDYHAAQTYADDGYVGAADLHARIHAAQAEFSPAYQAFSGLLHKRDAERRKADLEEMAGRKLRLTPAMLRAVDAAQNMQDYFQTRGLTSETIAGLEPDSFLALYDEYVRAAESFLNLTVEGDELISEGLREEALPEFRLRLNDVSASALPIATYCRNDLKDDIHISIKIGDLEKLSIDIGILVDIYNITIN